jgi:drug/metabolite transporter (DMT)-like permease
LAILILPFAFYALPFDLLLGFVTPRPISLSTRTKAEAFLVATTAIWGCTFVVVKGALADASPLPFLAVRFTLAGLLLLAILWRGKADWAAILPGSILGLFLFGGYLFQTCGLMYTTPSKSAFLTGFSVILVPLIVMLSGSRMGSGTLLGGVLGLAGIYLLVAPSGMTAVNKGDILTLAGAISFAVHIVLVGRYTKKYSFLHLVPVQVLVVGVTSLVAIPFVPDQTMHLTHRLVGAILVTAVLATGVAFSVQNWAQQYTPAAHTALIFALEPVFAALCSWLVIGEHLGGKVLLGSGLILAGMVISEIWGVSAPFPVEG